MEKILNPLTRSLNIEGEASFEEEADEFDFRCIEFEVIVLCILEIVERVFVFLFPLGI